MTPISRTEKLAEITSYDENSFIEKMGWIVWAYTLIFSFPIEKYVLNKKSGWEYFQDENQARRAWKLMRYDTTNPRDLETIKEYLGYIGEQVEYPDYPWHESYDQEYDSLPPDVQEWFTQQRDSLMGQLEFLFAAAENEKMPTSLLKAKAAIDAFSHALWHNEALHHKRLSVYGVIETMRGWLHQEIANRIIVINAAKAHRIAAAAHLLKGELAVPRDPDLDTLQVVVQLLKRAGEFGKADTLSEAIEKLQQQGEND